MPKRILIAEDEAAVRNAVRTFIETQTHFEVCEAVDGDDAIKKAESLKPDLVVLDLRMPKVNGIEVASRLNICMPSTPVVVFTMYEDKLGAPLATILGIAAVVPKKRWRGETARSRSGSARRAGRSCHARVLIHGLCLKPSLLLFFHPLNVGL